MMGPGDEPLEDFLSDSEFLEMCRLLNQENLLDIAIEYCEQNPNSTTNQWRRLIEEEFGR